MQGSEMGSGCSAGMGYGAGIKERDYKEEDME